MAEQKLRYGKRGAQYHHYTVMLDGVVEERADRDGNPVGLTRMSFNCWAPCQQRASEMAELFAKEFSFITKDRLQLCESEPAKPPCGIPIGYDFQFSPLGRRVTGRSD